MLLLPNLSEDILFLLHELMAVDFMISEAAGVMSKSVVGVLIKDVLMSF